ncbi:MAG: aminotransferase class I/II-fold pyridoxal phosphate-dependent enzyme [Pseudomonadota bacterium]
MNQDFPFLNHRVRHRDLKVPFVGPETLERQTGERFAARLGANESGFGPSPMALAAIREAASHCWKYADPTSHDLKRALAHHLGIGHESLVVGEGIDGLLGDTCKLTLEPGAGLVMSDGAYPTMAFHGENQAAAIHKISMRDDREDLAGLLDAAKRHGAKVIYLSNPNNPSGRHWPANKLEAFMDDLPEFALLLLDEAYADTAPADAIPKIAVKRRNVLRYRTFSKAYGLAGLRIGYAIGHPELVAEFEKVRNHYGVNLLAQVGAEAALRDQAYLTKTVAAHAAARRRITGIANASGFQTLPSATNFVAIDCREPSTAEQIYESLMADGVFVRRPTVPTLNRLVRVSTGPDDVMNIFEAAWKRATQRFVSPNVTTGAEVTA